jgi:hypothetical protein
MTERHSEAWNEYRFTAPSDTHLYHLGSNYWARYNRRPLTYNANGGWDTTADKHFDILLSFTDCLCGLVVSFWLQILKSWVRFPAASRFSEKQRVWNGVNSASWGQLRSYLEEIVAAPVKKTEINDRGDPLRWPRNTLYPRKLALLHQQAAVARSV